MPNWKIFLLLIPSIVFSLAAVALVLWPVFVAVLEISKAIWAPVNNRAGSLFPTEVQLRAPKWALGYLLVRGWTRGVWRLKFCRHKAISSSAISHEDSLSWLEFGEAPAAERLHMHEYVRRFRATREKAKPA